MSFLSELFLGNGKLNAQVRATLESEGLVLVEEGLSGSVRYRHFKAPGKRFHGKVRLERIAVGISEQRLAVYCRSGRTKLIDTPFRDPRMKILDLSVQERDTVSIRIDYDRAGIPKVSGEITIQARTPSAPAIVDQVQHRIGR